MENKHRKRIIGDSHDIPNERTNNVLELDCVGVTAAQALKRWIMMRSKVEVVLGCHDSGKVLLEKVDESVGGGVVGVDLC